MSDPRRPIMRRDHVVATTLLIEAAEHPRQVTETAVQALEAAGVWVLHGQIALAVLATRQAAAAGAADWFHRLTEEEVAELACGEVTAEHLTAALHVLRSTPLGGVDVGDYVPAEAITALTARDPGEEWQLALAMARVTAFAFPELRSPEQLAVLRAYLAPQD